MLAAIALTVTLTRYEFFGDELYFLAAGRRLAFGGADQGPLVPMVAHLTQLAAPGSPLALRIPVVVLSVAGIVVSAAIAREFGGGRLPQIVAAAAYATSPFMVNQSAMLSTFAFDATFLAVVTWLLARWVRTRQDWLLFAAGIVAAIDIQVKWLIPVAWVCLGIGVAVSGPRAMLRRPALWFGSAVFAAAGIPGLVWQSAHGWPQLAMGSVVGAEQDATGGGRIGCVVQMVGLAGLLGALLLAFGIWGVFRVQSLQPYRFLVPAFLIYAWLIALSDGRPYYIGGMFPVAFAAGAVSLSGVDAGRWARITGIPVLAISVTTVVAALTMVPLPGSWLRTPIDTPSQLVQRVSLYGTEGWSQLTETVDDAYRTLTPIEQLDTVIITQNYWQASALEEFGKPYHLPAIYSPNRGFGYFGAPPDWVSTVLYVGADNAAAALHTDFASVEPVALLDEHLGIPGINRKITVWKCERPTHPWSQTWTHMMAPELEQGL
ncbi:ArnT family glycosyltransferase [Nocardia altamirensis]|uniref:ArnT family glycosyltransferase n=1 Tax=Nocardia altamirensis TaxID=472158 RepID=UPI0009FCE96B|nr:glycosyltransferase family 39 protein [Nocardia altamirensis]